MPKVDCNVIVMTPGAGNKTRLVTRVRGNLNLRAMVRETPVYTWPFWLLIEPGAFLMERKMLLEIKRLAEAHYARAA